MGKRSKLLKGGLSKSNYKLAMQARKNREKEITSTADIGNNNNDAQMNCSDGSKEILEKKPSSQGESHNILNKTVYNEELINKHNSILGIDPKELKVFLSNPIRHRRLVNSTVLSRRQKHKLLRQERKQRIKLLEEKIKLNTTVMANPKLSMTYDESKQSKPSKFNLLDVDSTINNLIEEIGKEKKVANPNSNVILSSEPNIVKTSKRRRNKILLLNQEKQNMKRVLENKNFVKNPIEAMKVHLKTSQMLNERNKKIQDNFEKNYNMLNLKKNSK